MNRFLLLVTILKRIPLFHHKEPEFPGSPPEVQGRTKFLTDKAMETQRSDSQRPQTWCILRGNRNKQTYVHLQPTSAEAPTPLPINPSSKRCYSTSTMPS